MVVVQRCGRQRGCNEYSAIGRYLGKAPLITLSIHMLSIHSFYGRAFQCSGIAPYAAAARYTRSTSVGASIIARATRPTAYPRRPQGRCYPLAALLGVLVVGTLHGKSSLRGMWVWAEQHWATLWQPFGFSNARVPALTRLWNVVVRLD